MNEASAGCPLRERIGDRLALVLPNRDHYGGERVHPVTTDGPREPRGLDELVLGHLTNDLDLLEFRRLVRVAARALRPGGRLEFFALDPDALRGDEPVWPGTRLSWNDRTTRYRPWRQITELFRLFPLELHTPQPTPARDVFVVSATRHAAETHRSDHTNHELDVDVRYGAESTYRRFDRLEEPEILDDLLYALAAMRPREETKVLSVGVNDGRELELFREIGCAPDLWGVDLSASAIDAARARFPAHASQFLAHDASRLAELELPSFDLVLMLNTIQCTTLDRAAFLRDLGALLHPGSQLLITIPNCHFGTGDVLRRPLDRNDPRHDRSPVIKDLRYLTRHFHRAGFAKITTFGTYDLCLLIRP